MKWYTHAAVGANAVWLSVLTGTIDERTPLLIAAGAFAALVPDIDATKGGAKIHHIGGGIFGMFAGAFRHRAFFHSIVAALIVCVFSLMFLSGVHPLLPWVVTLGYVSHPLIDGWNLSGVQYLFPRKNMYRLVPKFLATPVGGFMDSIFFIVGVTGIAVFVFSQLPKLTAYHML